MDRNNLKKALLDRLPAGTSLDDELLDSVAGGFARALDSRPYNDLVYRNGEDDATMSDLILRDGDAGLLVLLENMPNRFESLEELKRWLADRKQAKKNPIVSL